VLPSKDRLLGLPRNIGLVPQLANTTSQGFNTAGSFAREIVVYG
jgi:hypothetical protein